MRGKVAVDYEDRGHFQYSARTTVVEKGLTAKDIGYTRTDVLVGSLMTDVVGMGREATKRATISAPSHGKKRELMN